MNRILVIMSLVLIFLVPGCSPGTDDSARETPGERAPVIGMTIPAGTFDAFYKGEITRIKLSDYRGKWLILFFYPADFTFVCPTELREMAEYYDRFRKSGAEVLAISTDSAYVHRAWHEQNGAVQKVRYPMLSDRSGALSRALGAYVADKGIAVRASFVVDPDGIIVAAELHDESIGRSAAELLRKLEAAVAVRAHEGDFCPAAWNPGDEMITPK